MVEIQLLMFGKYWQQTTYPVVFVFNSSYVQSEALFQNYADVLAILMRLRQLCCHPRLCASALALLSGKHLVHTNYTSRFDSLYNEFLRLVKIKF